MMTNTFTVARIDTTDTQLYEMSVILSMAFAVGEAISNAESEGANVLDDDVVIKRIAHLGHYLNGGHDVDVASYLITTLAAYAAMKHGQTGSLAALWGMV